MANPSLRSTIYLSLYPNYHSFVRPRQAQWHQSDIYEGKTVLSYGSSDGRRYNTNWLETQVATIFASLSSVRSGPARELPAWQLVRPGFLQLRASDSAARGSFGPSWSRLNIQWRGITFAPIKTCLPHAHANSPGAVAPLAVPPTSRRPVSQMAMPPSQLLVPVAFGSVECAAGVRCTIQGSNVDIVFHDGRYPEDVTQGIVQGHALVDGGTRFFAVRVRAEAETTVGLLEMWPRLHHPNILELLNVSRLQSCPQKYVFVWPFVRNSNFGRYLADNPRADRLQLMIDVATGLTYLHETARIAHGNVSHENVLVGDDGRALLVGFRDSVALAPARFSGTVAAAASDVEATGTLIYYVYYGTAAPGRAETSHSNGSSQRPLPAAGMPAIFAGLQAVCARCWSAQEVRPQIKDILSSLRGLSSDRKKEHVAKPQQEKIKDGLNLNTQNGVPGTRAADGEESTITPQTRETTATGDKVRRILRCKIDGSFVEILFSDQTALRGGMGHVMKGYVTNNGRNEYYAVKVCAERQVMNGELTLWRKLHHPNVLKLYTISRVGAAGNFHSEYVFVSPYMEQGNLQQYIKRNEWVDRLPLMADVARGLSYLHHDAMIVHGDIKAENVLISDDGQALLSDFGLSTTVLPRAEPTATHIRMLYSLVYCAPEIVDDNAEDPAAPGNKRSKTKMTDVYAYGMLLYQTYAGGLTPAQGVNLNLMVRMYNGELPQRPPATQMPVLCDELWNICKSAWSRDPSERPTSADILNKLTWLRR